MRILFAVISALMWPSVVYAHAVDGQPVYRIDASRASKLRLTITLELKSGPTKFGVDLRLVSRAASMRLRSQIGDVYCDGRRIKADNLGWLLPSGCQVASWQVRLAPPAANGALASDQQSGWYGSWGLVSEASSLLRIEGLKEGAKVRILDNGRWRNAVDLPSPGIAPAYYLFGRPSSQRTGDKELSIEFVSDHLQEVLRQVSPQDHLKALRYLRDTIPLGSRHDLKALKVVWFGVSRRRHSLGGASGYDTMLSNYIQAVDEPTEDEMLMSQVILLHEQFHQLVAAELPLWAGESLAQFYAFKAAEHTGGRGLALARLWARCCSAARLPELGLIEVQQQIQAGNASNYNLFYSKGAAFWRALDAQLSDSSHGKRDLDTILPIILTKGFDDEGMPSEALRIALALIPEDYLQQLFAQYLGRFPDGGSGPDGKGAKARPTARLPSE